MCGIECAVDLKPKREDSHINSYQFYWTDNTTQLFLRANAALRAVGSEGVCWHMAESTAKKLGKGSTFVSIPIVITEMADDLILLTNEESNPKNKKEEEIPRNTGYQFYWTESKTQFYLRADAAVMAIMPDDSFNWYMSENTHEKIGRVDYLKSIPVVVTPMKDDLILLTNDYERYNLPKNERHTLPKKKEQTPRGHLLESANNLVNGDRNNQYGPPTQDFHRTAEALNAYGYRGPQGRLLDSHDVAIIQMALKMSRLMWTPQKEDSWTDIAGYAACGYECALEEAKDVSKTG